MGFCERYTWQFACTKESGIKLQSDSVHPQGRVIEYDLPDLSQHFAVLSLNPWSADVVNSITTPGMNEYTWHDDIF